jgi:hypothetical protein
MNRFEIEEELKSLRQKQKVMENDLSKFATELSATSQVAIIARIAIVRQDIDDYQKMLDILAFDDIVRDQF